MFRGDCQDQVVKPKNGMWHWLKKGTLCMPVFKAACNVNSGMPVMRTSFTFVFPLCISPSLHMLQDAQRACHRYCQDWRQGACASGGNEKGFRRPGQLSLNNNHNNLQAFQLIVTCPLSMVALPV